MVCFSPYDMLLSQGWGDDLHALRCRLGMLGSRAAVLTVPDVCRGFEGDCEVLIRFFS